MTEPEPIVGDRGPTPAGPSREPLSGPPAGPSPDSPPPDPALDAPPQGLHWWQTPAGQLVMAWEQTRFDQQLADVFGLHAVQLGLAQWPVLRTNRMPLHLVVSLASHRSTADRPTDLPTDLPGSEAPIPSGQRPASLILEHFQSLPFADASLDLVVAPHGLEMDADPRQTLREIARVLRPEGRLVLTGFNPVSLWGAQHLMGRQPGGVLRSPWISLPRLKDWYALLGLECVLAQHGVYRPGLAQEKWLERMRFLERAGDRWWPICGAVYLTVAVKRVPAIRMIGADFRRKRMHGQPAAVGARRQA